MSLYLSNSYSIDKSNKIEFNNLTNIVGCCSSHFYLCKEKGKLIKTIRVKTEDKTTFNFLSDVWKDQSKTNKSEFKPLPFAYKMVSKLENIIYEDIAEISLCLDFQLKSYFLIQSSLSSQTKTKIDRTIRKNKEYV